jgi:uncharacterized protein YprB with RNaseH-like and TPR domain
MKRTELRRERQAVHHQRQIDRAALPRHKLAAACQYLIAEVTRAGDAEAVKATELVRAYVKDLRARTHVPQDLEYGENLTEGTPT